MNITQSNIQKNIFKQIDWAIHNFSKSDWEDYGASGCLSSNDMDEISEDLKQLSATEVGEVLTYVLDNYRKKKYAEWTVTYILSSLDDMEDFDVLLDNDYRFEY